MGHLAEFDAATETAGVGSELWGETQSAAG